MITPMVINFIGKLSLFPFYHDVATHSDHTTKIILFSLARALQGDVKLFVESWGSTWAEKPHRQGMLERRKTSSPALNESHTHLPVYFEASIQSPSFQDR